MTVSELNGWLVFDKPLGITSAQAINRIKHVLPRGIKIGHAGTLDPLASGVLPVAIGEATKTIQFAMDKIKTYAFQVTWGEERATDDAEGEVITHSEKRPVIQQILAILAHYMGKIQQLPPNYSAIKLNGKRAYAMARAGQVVELKAREVEIFSLCHGEEPQATERLEQSNFIVTCGKGTYVRSLARDMGRELGCFGYVSGLRRIKVGKFHEDDAISLESLAEMMHKGCLNWLHPVESVLDDIPAWEITPADAARLKFGQSIPLPPECLDELAIAMLDKKAIAICHAAEGVMKPVRVFN